MNSCLRMFLVAAVAVTGLSAANAAIVVVAADGLLTADGTTPASVGGATATYEGNMFQAGGSPAQVLQRWTAPGTVGTDFVGTFGGTDTGSTDWYVNGSGINQAVSATGENYLEFFYSLSGDTTGNNMRLSFTGAGGEADGGGQFALIPTSAGSHSFVVDANQFALGGPGSTITGIRWDPWNEEAGTNRGTTFTLDKVVYGTSISAVPEPSSLAVLAIAGVGIVARRRKRTA